MLAFGKYLTSIFTQVSRRSQHFLTGWVREGKAKGMSHNIDKLEPGWYSHVGGLAVVCYIQRHLVTLFVEFIIAWIESVISRTLNLEFGICHAYV